MTCPINLLQWPILFKNGPPMFKLWGHWPIGLACLPIPALRWPSNFPTRIIDSIQKLHRSCTHDATKVSQKSWRKFRQSEERKFLKGYFNRWATKTRIAKRLTWDRMIAGSILVWELEIFFWVCNKAWVAKQTVNYSLTQYSTYKLINIPLFRCSHPNFCLPLLSRKIHQQTREQCGIRIAKNVSIAATIIGTKYRNPISNLF